MRDELGADSYAPYSGAEFDLISGEITVDAEPVRIEKKSQNTGNIYYNDLVFAAERLSRLISQSGGRANADMRRLTEAINRLCEDWEI